MRTKRILVTGGAGFVGSHLCERLVGMQHEVVAMDNLSTGALANIAHLMTKPNFSFVEHDITLPYQHECDQIYNLACPASPCQYQRDPVSTTLTSVMGTYHGLQAAAASAARFLQASTSEVYGDADVHPQVESYLGNVNPIGIRACYDEGKRCAESLVMDFRRTRGVSCRIARIFNTYGPRMSIDDGRVVSNFIAQALRGDDITVYGDGSQTRSFCYVDDLVTGLIQLMECSDEVGPINLGNPCEFTVLELAKEVLRLTTSRARIVFSPLPEDDPKKRRPDIALAKTLLGFRVSTPLSQGLVRTIDSFRQALETSATRRPPTEPLAPPTVRSIDNGSTQSQPASTRAADFATQQCGTATQSRAPATSGNGVGGPGAALAKPATNGAPRRQS